MATRRVIIIAPTKATCENLYHLIRLDKYIKTILMDTCEAEIDAATDNLSLGGFGIIGGTGIGKSVGIRHMCRRILFHQPLKIGVITQEHRASAKTAGCNVLIMTPGVAYQQAKSGQITKDDRIVIDEVHQTSEHLEMAMALLKLIGCVFIWLSATIDPEVYRKYLDARIVIECKAYDETRRAKIAYHNVTAKDFLKANLQDIAARQRGVAIFVPTRKDAEDLAKEFNGKEGVTVLFYHGGVPAESLKPLLEGTIPCPYVIVMTPAGASSLNIAGLDTVVIVDNMFSEIIRNGKRKRVSSCLDNNTLLQMAGRVDGRAIAGEVYILTSNTELDLRAISPVSPSFVLGGDLEVLALTTAQMGIDARNLSLIGGLDLDAYNVELERLMARRMITSEALPRLTPFGAQIENMSIGTVWGPLVVAAMHYEAVHPGLTRLMTLTASVDEIYQLTSRDWSNDGEELAVAGSDHLTCHNIVAQAIRTYGRKTKDSYRFDGNSFMDWCKDRGYSSKGIRAAVMQYTSLMRRLDIKLPEPGDFQPVVHGDGFYVSFINLLIAVQSMDYVRNQSQNGKPVEGNGKRGFSHGNSVLGHIRYWNRKGVTYAAIEGTEVPDELLVKCAAVKLPEIIKIIDDERVLVRYQINYAGQADEVDLIVAHSELPPGVGIPRRAKRSKSQPPLGSYGQRPTSQLQ